MGFLRLKKKAAHFAPIRFYFPTVDWRADKDRYTVDARSKGGARNYRADQEEALALAEKLAADFEFKGRSAFLTPDVQTPKLSELGTTPQEVIAQYLPQRHASATKSLAGAFDGFEQHKNSQGLRTRF